MIKKKIVMFAERRNAALSKRYEYLDLSKVLMGNISRSGGSTGVGGGGDLNSIYVKRLLLNFHELQPRESNWLLLENLILTMSLESIASGTGEVSVNNSEEYGVEIWFDSEILQRPGGSQSLVEIVYTA